MSDYCDVSTNWEDVRCFRFIECIVSLMLIVFSSEAFLFHTLVLVISVLPFIDPLVNNHSVLFVSSLFPVVSLLVAVALAPVLLGASLCWCARLLNIHCLILWWAQHSSLLSKSTDSCEFSSFLRGLTGMSLVCLHHYSQWKHQRVISSEMGANFSSAGVMPSDVVQFWAQLAGM